MKIIARSSFPRIPVVHVGAKRLNSRLKPSFAFHLNFVERAASVPAVPMGRSVPEITVLLTIKAKPGSRASELHQGIDGTWIAHLKAQPVDGKANEELIRLVATHFSVARSVVSVKRGVSSRTKVVQISSKA
jgi:uncharacterized protein